MAETFLAILWIMLVWRTLQNKHGVSSEEIKVFRKGTDLELRCSSEGSNNLTWWFKDKPLYNNTVLTNEGTTLLQISNVSVKNQGIYWCGSSWKQGTNVTVLIGDLPSPPRYLYTTSFEWDKVLHWNSSEKTGGLVVHYTVLINCIKNCDAVSPRDVLYVPSKVENCEGLKHGYGKQYSCDLNNNADLYTTYNANVYAINSLGNSSASITFMRPDYSHLSETTPGPPLKLIAEEVQPGKVKLSWNKRSESRPRILYYRIVYKQDGDLHNKTLPEDKDGSQTSALIDNLDADTTYHFFVTTQYRGLNLFSPFSSPAVASLHTKYQAPDQPPQKLKCTWATDSRNRKTIMISWEPPSKKHQNGPLTIYKISYKESESRNSSLMIVNANQTQANLTNVTMEKTMTIYISACNKGGSCSGISNSCYVSGTLNTTKQEIPGGSSTTVIVFGSVAGSLCAIVIIAVCYCFCKKRTSTTRTPSISLPDIGNPYVDYDEVNDDPQDEDYDTPLV